MKGLAFLLNTSTSIDRSSLDLADRAIRGGIDLLQWRHKGEYSPEFLALGQTLAQRCRQANVLFFVNDRTDIALQLNADGVHLGQEDMPISQARALLGTHKRIGGTASTICQAQQVERDGADYVSLGHIFPTTSKQKNYPPLGVALLKEVVQAIHIPVFAIGGINETNLISVWETGVAGIAVISAIASATDPYLATQKLKGLIC